MVKDVMVDLPVNGVSAYHFQYVADEFIDAFAGGIGAMIGVVHYHRADRAHAQDDEAPEADEKPAHAYHRTGEHDNVGQEIQWQHNPRLHPDPCIRLRGHVVVLEIG